METKKAIDGTDNELTIKLLDPNDKDEQGNPGAVDDVYVIYQKETYTVKYLDGDHGKSDGKGDQPSEYYDSAVTGGNTVTPSRGYKFTGTYTYVIKDKNGNVIENGTTDDPTSLKVTGNIEFTPVYEKLPWAIWIDPATGRTIKVQTPFLDENTEPDPPLDPKRDGYTFAGWDRSVDADGNVTYTAKWTKNPVDNDPTTTSDEKDNTGTENRNDPVATNTSSDDGTSKSGSSKTGDDTDLIMWLCLMIISLTGIALAYATRRNERRKAHGKE